MRFRVNLNNRTRLLFLLLLLIFSYLIYTTEIPDSVGFVSAASTQCEARAAANLNSRAQSSVCEKIKPFNAYLIPQPNFFSTTHSATLVVLPNNHLLAMWFAGSHEGKSDVKIWQSEFNGRAWSMATVAISPELISKLTGQFVKAVGNPVVYLASDGTLHLFVVSVGLVGGWSASGLNHFASTDMAKTWHGGQRLMLSPFFNLSTLVRSNAISLSDGGFYLPVYHELIRTYAELLRFDRHGNFIQQIRISSGHEHLLQPAILALSATEAMAFMRNNAKTDNKKLYYQMTHDGGMKWLEPEATNLINQDSSLTVSKVDFNFYLMVHNPNDRSRLVLAISHNGRQWKDIYTLDACAGQEFSYPALVIHRGIIDILYTRNRTAIKHVRFSVDWLRERISRDGNENVN